MARTRTVPFRVSEHEMARIEVMANMEKLPIGTFIRRRILFEADQRGIVVPDYREKHNRTDVRQDSNSAAVI
jgi:hypothetical protein